MQEMERYRFRVLVHLNHVDGIPPHHVRRRSIDVIDGGTLVVVEPQKHDPAITTSDEMVRGLSDRYREIYRILTGSDLSE